jgi:hypothetical protein
MTSKEKDKKIYRTIKKKWLQPFTYASLMSLMLYIIIGDIVAYRYTYSSTAPHFVISRIDEKFDQTEYMHMLLTIQEINKTILREDLKRFAAAPFPAKCPKYLKQQLYKMNWDAPAFQIRLKKLFKMYDIYDQVVRLETTIDMLYNESLNSNLGTILHQQMISLTKERDRIIESSLTEEEYEFIKEYGGVVPTLQLLDTK